MKTIPESLHACYPFPQNWVKLPDGKMHYADTGGDGETLLLLHGNPSWSFLWRGLMQSLAAQGFRCIAPDHLGMGLSEKPKKFFRLADRVTHIEQFIERLNLGKFHLGVHDWGGAIGFGVAARNPARIGKILVTNTAAFRSKNIPRRIAFCRDTALGAFLVRHFNGFAWPATFMAVAQPMTPLVKKGFLFPYDTPGKRDAIVNFVKDIPLDEKHPSYTTLLDIENSLEKLRGKPMFIAWGGRDFCFDDTFFAEWKKRFPDAIFRYHAGAGHYVLEDAGATLIPEIKAFLGA